jgi:hypothetical protein
MKEQVEKLPEMQDADSPEIDHRSPLIPITILPVSDQRGRSEATLAF